MKVEGSCHCGQLSFEAEINPDDVRICHCTDCQVLSGSVYRVNVKAPVAGSSLNPARRRCTSKRRKAATDARTASAPTAAPRSIQPMSSSHARTASAWAR